ncbi:heparinase II/III family protein [Nonomuraea thailandensis]
MQRTGWSATDWYLRLNADRGNHGHPDELAIQLYAHDRPLLPAMGAYSYAADPTADWLRKSTQAHNTITIDGRAQNPTAAGAVSNLSLPWADLADGFTDATPGSATSAAPCFCTAWDGWSPTPSRRPTPGSTRTSRTGTCSPTPAPSSTARPPGPASPREPSSPSSPPNLPQ